MEKQHSFGGRSFDRFVYDFDPDDEVGEVPAEAVVEEPTAAEEEAWALAREEWEQTQQYLHATAPIIQQLAQMLESGATPGVAQPAQQPDPFDPFDPESVQKHIQREIAAGLEAELGEYKSLLGMVATREGETIAKQELEQLTSELGTFDTDMALALASGAMTPGADPAPVLRNAAKFVRNFEERIRKEEREQVQGRLQGLGAAPGSPGTPGPSVTETETVPVGPRRYQEAIERALATRNAVRPVG
jgi:hypothetical protein